MPELHKDVMELVATLASATRHEQEVSNSLGELPLVMRLNTERKTRLSNFESLGGVSVFLPTHPPNLINISSTFGTCGFIFIDQERLILQKDAIKEGSALILTNNILAGLVERFGYSEIFELRERLSRSLIIFHDYDCHHWSRMTFLGQILSDFYFPAHYSSVKIFSPYLESIKPTIPIGSIQWSRDFLVNHLDLISSIERSLLPLGRHAEYAPFQRRNSIVNILNINIPSVSLLRDDYHKMSQYDKLRDWVGFKCHFTVPGALDLPIRVFDALITGGIPIVPKFLYSSLRDAGVLVEDCVFYGTNDVLDPTWVIAEACAKFDAESPVLRFERYGQKIHATGMFNRLLGYVETELSLNRKT